MTRKSEVCKICRKIKKMDDFSNDRNTICNTCWEKLYKENCRRADNPLIKKRENPAKRVGRKHKSKIDPTIQVHHLRVKGCKCPAFHLVSLFYKETRKDFTHLPDCPLKL